MQDRIETTDRFTDAARAVLTEIDYDQLPLPIGMQPSETGVRVQVSQEDFVTWTAVLATASPVKVLKPAYLSEGLERVVEHVEVAGTINCHAVTVITVRDADVAAVAS